MDEPDVEIAFRAGSISVSQASSHTPSSNTCSKVLIQIIIPDHHWKFVYKVPTSTLVRELLRRVLSSCRLDVFEYANYGLYIPPTGTQKGKFLQEERLLSEYPQLLTSPADDLEDLHSPPFIDEEDEEQLTRLGKAASLKLIRKCRFVDALPLGHTRFKQINSKSHKKQLLGAIQSHNLQRIDILLDRGLDPNFQYKLNGDTPLCCAAEQWHPRELILKLVEKGAHLEFRDSETLTPLHRAARAGNFEAIKALLDLGQNPNVRDARDLTPLYHAVSKDVPTRCITQLLYDHAILGVMDDKNRQEIHQACLFDRPQHLEQLIIYGADLDAQAANLDTPLHICALNNHETCLRLLLKYGATRDLLNASGQTPSEVAMLTGLNRLAEVIDSFTDDQIAPVTKPPVYNQDRKPSVTGPRAAFENVRERLSAAQVNGFGQVSKSDQMNDAGSFDQAPKPTVNNHMVWKDSVSTSNRVPTATGVPAQAKHCISSSTNDLVNRTVSYNSRASYQPVSRVVRLQRGSTGFGFQIRGRTVSSGGDSTSYVAANQYIDRIIPGSPAAEARLNPGDYILQINGQDVSRASHYQVTDLIVQSGSEVTLTVLPGPPRTLPSLQSPFQRNRSRLLISDRRHASCRRTSSSIAVRPDRSVSRDTSFGAPFCSSRSDRFLSQADEPSSASSSSVFYSTQRTTNAALNGIGSGYGASAAVGARDSRNVTVYREFQKRSVSSPYFEPYRSSSSRNSSSLSCNSGIDGMQTNHNYVNSVDFIGYNTNSSVSGCNSADVTHPRILLVHEDVDDDDAPITVDHVWPEENGDSIYRLSSSTQGGRITRSMDQWPHVILSLVPSTLQKCTSMLAITNGSMHVSFLERLFSFRVTKILYIFVLSTGFCSSDLIINLWVGIRHLPIVVLQRRVCASSTLRFLM